MKLTYSPLITLQRWWLFAFLVVIPFAWPYLTNKVVAISYINIFSLVFIVLGLLALATGQIPWRKVDRGTWMIVGLLMLAMFFALFFTHPLRDGVGLWTSRLLQPFLVGLFVYQMLTAKVLKLEEIALALLLSLIPLIIGGALQKTGVIAYKDSLPRVTVLYRWPNTFARYVEILLLASLPFIWFKLKKYQKWAFLLWITGVGLLLLTESYNAVATFTLACILFLLLLPKHYRKIQLLLLGFLTAAIFITALNVTKLPKYERSVKDSKETRLEFWQIASSTIKDHFWTGIGIKGWETQYPQLLKQYDTGRHLNYYSEQPHNIFLDSMLKAGPLGLVAVLAFLLWPLFQGWRIYREKGPLAWFGLSMVLCGLGMFLFGFIDDPLWSDDVMPLYYLFLFSIAFIRSNQQQTT